MPLLDRCQRVGRHMDPALVAPAVVVVLPVRAVAGVE